MDLYYSELSPPNRACILTAQFLESKINLKYIDLMRRENLGEAYAKINSQKVVPMLVEGDFTLGESRAIMMYLAERDGVEHKIYPRDPKIRALINSRLLFDQGTLYQRFVDYYYPQIFSKKPALPEKYKMFEQALGHLDTFLENSKFVAGDQLSLADLSIFTSCSTFKISAGIDLGKYSNISRWYDECENVLPGMDFDRKGAEVFRKLFELIET